MKSRSVVVQVDPREQTRRRILMGLAIPALFLAGLAVGNLGLIGDSIEYSGDNERLRAEVVRQARELEELRQWKTDNQTRREIDEAALELVRQELAQQQETIAELEKGVQFYRSLMAPDEQADGLTVRSIDLTGNGDPNSYQFRILVQQSSRKHELLKGTLQVTVNGLQDGEPKSYNLSDISDQLPSADIRLRFKYFQAIDGELSLPEGFSPQSLSASARSSTPRRAVVESEFPWSVQEKISHVGQ